MVVPTAVPKNPTRRAPATVVVIEGALIVLDCGFTKLPEALIGETEWIPP
jgi:hypothetical protein